ncbi:tRNA adenosine(34) deaminase TadA [Thermodesulfobacteriota bacterium]
MSQKHEDFMQLALREAEKAGQKDEIPVGALLVAASGDILSSAYNQTITRSDPTAHAEILVLREAARNFQNYRLLNTTMYATIEPCLMCMGAIVHARVATVVFGAADPKWGAAGSLYNLAEDARLNHQPRIISGVCEDACKAPLQNFFQTKRKRRNSVSDCKKV